MRVGISVASNHAAADDHRDGARWMVERVRAAKRAGLDSLSLGDHHAMTVPYYQNTPMLGRLLAEWDQRPAGCLFLVPLWHPVLMAEQIGTLAAITSGPFVVQTGIGGGTEQFAAMGADLGARGAVLDESIELVRSLLAGETVDSERWGITGASISPRPPEGVEWWIGGGAPVALDRAARLGDAWYGGPELTRDTAAKALATYRERCEAHDRSPARIAIRKDVIVAADPSRARAFGDDLLAGGYRGMPREAVAYGSPAEVAEQLAPFAELGFTDVIARSMAVPQAMAIETVEGLGEVREMVAAA